MVGQIASLFRDRAEVRPPDVAEICAVAQRLGSSMIESDLIVAAALRSIVRGVNPLLALGLQPGPGERSPVTVFRLEQRDQLIRAMARQFYGDQSANRAATEIAREIASYERNAAAIDLHLYEPPASYAGRPRELLFWLNKLGAGFPAKASIRRILQRCCAGAEAIREQQTHSKTVS